MIFELVDDIENLIYDEIKQYYNVKNSKVSYSIAKWQLLKGVDINKIMYRAAYGGYLELVTQLIEKGANKLNVAIHGAAKGGHLELVNFFIEKGADDWSHAIHGAAEGGNIALVNFFIEKGANDLDWAMHGAAKGGHHHLINICIEKGATNFKECYYTTGNTEIKDLLRQYL